MKPHIKKLKAELKALASTISKSRSQFKDAQRFVAKQETHDSIQRAWKDAGRSEAELSRARYEYRHKHIVRCILRGTPREKIEQPKEENKPSEKYIEKLLAEVLSEALRVDQGGSIEESAGSTGGACGSGVLSTVSQEPMERDASVPKMSDARNAPNLINRLTTFLRGDRVS